MAGNYNYGGNGGFYREWMYKRFDEATGNFTAEFEAGVEEFMTFANSQPIVQVEAGVEILRLSDRNGLGPHIHFSGPKSFQQVKDELEEELGRPVSLGEVFIKTHTRPDGTYVDRKAEKIAKTYHQNVQEKLSELDAEAEVAGDTSAVSDGASRPRELTTEEYTAIFLKSTDRDSRGNFYGVGNIKDCLLNGKRKQPDSSSSFVSLQEQLKEAQRKIEEQAAREAEQSRAVAEQRDRLEQLSLVEKYLLQTDPHFLDFMASQSAKEPTSDPLTTTLPLDDTTTTPSPYAAL